MVTQLLPKVEEDASPFNVSIIIPTYNELENIGKIIRAINGLQLRQEIVVVDDSSPDATAGLVSKLSMDYNNVKFLVRPRKMGIGSAYKDGLKLASGNILFEMDADLSHNPQELSEIADALEHADVVVASRHVSGGRIVGWKWYRKLIHTGANLFAELVLGLKVKDSTSGFRAYRRAAFEQIVLKSRFDGFEFQVEAIHIARKLGLKVTEVPTTFINRRYGNSKLHPKDIISFAKAILKMKLRRGLI